MKSTTTIIICLLLHHVVIGQVKDRDGNNYKTKTIGQQEWIVQNLNTSTFRNGDEIYHAKTDKEWIKAGMEKKPAWCYYKNNPANGEKYGKLYNFYAINDKRGLAPEGYHIPTDQAVIRKARHPCWHRAWPHPQTAGSTSRSRPSPRRRSKSRCSSWRRQD